MKIIFPIITCAVALIVFLMLSHPLELRSNRWLKIAFSLPLVLFLALRFSAGVGMVNGLGLIIAMTGLAFIWRATISGLMGNAFSNFFYSDISSATGLRPDFRYAKNHRRDGELDLAVAAIGHELKKDPNNFEGLMLLSSVYQDLKQPENALVQLELLTNNPEASEAQKQIAQSEKKRCEQLKQHLAFMR